MGVAVENVPWSVTRPVDVGRMVVHDDRRQGMAKCQQQQVSPRVGFEPTPDPCISKDLQQSIDEKAGKSKVFGAKSKQIPPELASIVEAWPDLPKPVKAGILAMVKAATQPDKSVTEGAP